MKEKRTYYQKGHSGPRELSSHAEPATSEPFNQPLRHTVEKIGEGTNGDGSYFRDVDG